MACAYVPVDTAYLSGLLDYIDCQAQTIGAQGYLALAAPGSIASLVLTALLTILIALFGYRMLLGHTPTLGETTLTLVKIGIVVALATSWQGYRTVFYDAALHGPAELTSAIGVPSGLPGAGGGLVSQLDTIDQQFQALAAATSLRPFAYRPGTAPPPLFQGFNTFALGASRVAFLIGTAGALAAVRLVAGLLLALGPLFIAFLLFDGTRGLFEGWLRVLAGAALGGLATAIMLGVELALLGPWLADLLGRVGADQPIPGAPAQLLATSLIFDMALLAMVGAASRVAWSLRMPVRPDAVRPSEVARRTGNEAAAMERRGVTLAENRSRSAAVVDAIAAAERREASSGAGSVPAIGSPDLARMPMFAPAGLSTSDSSGFGSVNRRRVRTRVSAKAGLRDRLR